MANNRTNYTIIAQQGVDSLTLPLAWRNNQPAAEIHTDSTPPISKESRYGNCRNASPTRHAPTAWSATASRWRGTLLLLAQAALPHRHRAHRRLPRRAHHLELREPSTAPSPTPSRSSSSTRLPLVRFLEWGFIFIPLAYHALYGVFIAIRGRNNVNVYPWAGNWMYLSQRVTGIIALLYIVQHLWRQRFTGVMLPEHPGAAFHKVQVELSNPWMLAIYVIAMIATTWHFAYGIWLFAAKWGITPGEKARKRFGYVCAVGGTALCLMGLVSM